jgi:hypothetical protein
MHAGWAPAGDFDWPDVVPLAEVRAHLPGDTPLVTSDERRRAIQQRATAVRRRFGF